MKDDPVQATMLVQRDRPPVKTAELYTFRLLLLLRRLLTSA